MKKSRKLLALLLAVVMVVGALPTALAAQDSAYHDPTEHWIRASNRTSELDSNAIVTRETFKCVVCDMQTSFVVFRTPEYTRDGVSAMTRNVFFSDGASLEGEIVSRIYDGVPGVDATYTGNHWTKAICENCGTTNANVYSEYGIGKDLYVLSDCALNFMQDLDETVEYTPTDSQRHTKTVKGGQYCVFCFGTNHTEATALERHNMDTTVTAEAGNHRFKVMESCADCGYSATTYLAAKAVVANYYGVVDGAAHTLTVSDLSDDAVTTSIRYGTTAANCNLTSAPNYTDEGQYTVYYEITYTYGGVSLTENGVAYVQLRAENEPTAETLGCATHNFALASTVAPTCTSLGYDHYICTLCGMTEDRNYTAALDHNWQEYTVREATCGVTGKVAYICTRCGQVRSYETSAGAHAYSLFSVPATCTSSGYEAEVCSICGDTHVLNVSGTAAHNYIATTVPATCTTSGRTTYRCSTCGDSYTDNYMDPLGHVWDLGKVITASTCTTEGVKEYRCNRCNVTTLEAIPATGHTPGDPATCTTPQVCTVCNTVLRAANGHTPGDAATCTTPQVCTTCGVTLNEATGHSFVVNDLCGQPDYCSVCGAAAPVAVASNALYAALSSTATIHNYIATTTAATCTSGSWTTYRCTACGDSYTDAYTEALGHAWDNGVIITAPTCATAGVKQYTCSRCNVTTLEPIPATGHSYQEAITPATCTTAGQIAYRCTACGDSYTSSYMDALGHNWDKGSVVIVPNCTGDGVTEYNCTRCAAHYLEAHSAIGHTPGKAATCTEAHVCTVCGVVLNTAKGHNYKKTVIPATCTEGGKTVFACADCGSSYEIDPTEALGHNWDGGKLITRTTCTGDGVTEYSCTRCSAHYLEAETAEGHTPGPDATCTDAQLCAVCGVVLHTATGHHYTETVIPATCTEGGITIHYCEGCGDSYETDPTEPLGHNWDEGSVVTGNSCVAEGVLEYHCRRCGEYRLEGESATGHRPGPEATCDQPQTCLDCGAILKKALGHSYRTTVTAATCEDMGFTTHYCYRCGDSYQDSYTKALGHTAGAWVIDREATAYRDGQRHTVCKVCGKTLETETIPKLTTTAYTDNRGQATVGGYLVTVTDTDTRRAISRAEVELDGYAIFVTLPSTRTLVYDDQVTITVQREADNSAIRGMNVTVSDAKDNSAEASTDRYGKVTLPDEPETEYHTAYIVGLPDGRANPSGTMTRAEAATIFARLLADKNGAQITASSTRYSDVPSNAWYSGYVRYLDYCGVVYGVPGNLFMPDAPITRAEFTVMAARFFTAMGGEMADFQQNYTLNFYDLTNDYWATGYIWQATQQGWVLGDGSGAFRAEDNITRAEAVTIVNRLLGREADKDYISSYPRQLRYFTDLNKSHWAYYDFMEAANGHTAILNSSEEGWQ